MWLHVRSQCCHLAGTCEENTHQSAMARRMKLRCARCALAATTDECTVPWAGGAAEFASKAWITGAAVAVPAGVTFDI